MESSQPVRCTTCYDWTDTKRLCKGCQQPICPDCAYNHDPNYCTACLRDMIVGQMVIRNGPFATRKRR